MRIVDIGHDVSTFEGEVDLVLSKSACSDMDTYHTNHVII